MKKLTPFYVIAFFIPPLIFGSLKMVSTFSEIMIPRGTPAALLAPPSPPKWDKKKPWVVILLGTNGTQVSDLFASYSVFSASGQFNVATLAVKKEPLPTTGRIFVYPDLTLSDAPPQIRLLVLPAVLDPGEPALVAAAKELAKRSFATLSLSEGSRLAAAAGIFNGRRATAPPLAAEDIARHFPSVLWQKPQTWVQDGFLFSSSGLGLSLEASLQALLRIKPSAFNETAKVLGFNSTFRQSETSSLGDTTISFSDWVQIFMHAGFTFGGRDIAIPVFDGVDEVFTAAVLDTLSRTFSALPFPVSPKTGVYTSRFGMRLLAPHSIEESPPPRTLIVPPSSKPMHESFLSWASRRAEIRFFTQESPAKSNQRAAWIALDLTRSTSQGIVRFALKSQNLTAIPLQRMTQEIPSRWGFLFWLRPLFMSLLGLGAVYLLRHRIRSVLKTTRSK